MTAYEKVKAARDPARPTATDYINSIFTAFTEMATAGFRTTRRS